MLGDETVELHTLRMSYSTFAYDRPLSMPHETEQGIEGALGATRTHVRHRVTSLAKLPPRAYSSNFSRQNALIPTP
jgi:hypothetical protein